MSEVKDIDKKELQEMARTILCEIYNTSAHKIRFDGSGIFEREEQVGLSLDYRGPDGFERQHANFENAGNFQSRYLEAAEPEGDYPRLSRREFLNHRIERRSIREGAHKTAANAKAKAESGVSTRFGNPIQGDLPEKLSDTFCKDARRYDGAYERF